MNLAKKMIKDDPKDNPKDDSRDDQGWAMSTKDERDQTSKVRYGRTIRLSVFDCSQAAAYANLIGLKDLAGNARSKAPG